MASSLSMKTFWVNWKHFIILYIQTDFSQSSILQNVQVSLACWTKHQSIKNKAVLGKAKLTKQTFTCNFYYCFQCDIKTIVFTVIWDFWMIFRKSWKLVGAFESFESSLLLFFFLAYILVYMCKSLMT